MVQDWSDQCPAQRIRGDKGQAAVADPHRRAGDSVEESLQGRPYRLFGRAAAAPRLLRPCRTSQVVQVRSFRLVELQGVRESLENLG
jgi:hypothetical protein